MCQKANQENKLHYSVQYSFTSVFWFWLITKTQSTHISAMPSYHYWTLTRNWCVVEGLAVSQLWLAKKKG